MQVKVGKRATEGSGTNEKVAKCSADKNMLEIPGFKKSRRLSPPNQPSNQRGTPTKKAGDGRTVTFYEPASGDENGTSNKEEFRIPYLSHQQLPAGILPMVLQVAQAVGVSQGHHTKGFTRVALSPAKAHGNFHDSP